MTSTNEDNTNGNVVIFGVDQNYSDPKFPGPSIITDLIYIGDPPLYLRVASEQTAPDNEAGGLIDVTKPFRKLAISHPVTGIKPGDHYTVFLGTGDTKDGSMNARKYTLAIGPKDTLAEIDFAGCTPLGPIIPSRISTPYP